MACFSVLLILTSAGTTGAQAQGTKSASDVFSGAEQFSKGATEVKDINLDKDALKVAGSFDKEASAIVGMMDAVSIHKYTYPRDGLYSMPEVLQYSRRCGADGWKQVVHKQDSSELKDICTRSVDGGEWKELAILKAEPKELKFVYLRYHGSLANLGVLDDLGGKESVSPDPKLTHRNP